MRRRLLTAVFALLAVGGGAAAVAVGTVPWSAEPAQPPGAAAGAPTAAVTSAPDDPAATSAPDDPAATSVPDDPPATSGPDEPAVAELERAGVAPTPAPTEPPGFDLVVDAPKLPTTPPSPPPDTAPLDGRLSGIVDRDDLTVNGVVGIAVLDEHGRVVFAREADRLLLPASTQKAVTAAAALATFGPDHRFTTAVGVRTRRPGPSIAPDGTVDGDLVLIGGGDPVLASRGYRRFIYPARPRTRLEQLADAVVAAGVRNVSGGVVGDGSIFGTDADARGWKREYFWDFDARHITGLTVDAGLRYAIRQPPPDLELKLEISPDPAGQAASLLHQALTRRGVEFGAKTDSRRQAVPVTDIVASASSPRLDTLLRHALERSDNHLADTVFRDVGHSHFDRGSWDLSALAARRVFDHLGVPHAGAVFADGSGLSRSNRISAAQLARLDLAMASSSQADRWAAIMAVAGEEGTLRRRLTATIAQGRFRGKTGTLNDVKSLVGAVEGPGERSYHLAVVGNELTGRGRWVVRVLMDEMVLALTADLYGCRFVTPQSAPSPSPSPPQPLVSRAECPEP